MECELLRSPMISYRSLLYNTTVLYDKFPSHKGLAEFILLKVIEHTFSLITDVYIDFSNCSIWYFNEATQISNTCYNPNILSYYILHTTVPFTDNPHSATPSVVSDLWCRSASDITAIPSSLMSLRLMSRS